MDSDEIEILNCFPRSSDNSSNSGKQFESKIKRKTKLKKERHKDAPIPWRNSYILYVKERRSNLKQSYYNNVDLRKVIAQDWKNLSPNERQRFDKASEIDRNRYLRELEEFKRKIETENSVTSSIEIENKDEQQKTPDISESKTNDDLLRSNSTTNSIDHQETNENLNTSSNFEEKTEDDVVNQGKFEVKIFTDEFIEHNRIRQMEMNDLRKSLAECEFQNTKLSRMVENVQNDIDNIQNEISVRQSENYYLTNLIKKIQEELESALAKSQHDDLIEISKIADKNSFVDALNKILLGKNDKLNKKLTEIVSKIQLIDLEPKKTVHNHNKRNDQDDYFDGNTERKKSQRLKS